MAGHSTKGKRGGSAKGTGKKRSLKISPKERVKVTHEINNAYHIRYKGKRHGVIVTFNEKTKKAYNYLFEINDFDDYNIYSKTLNED